MPIFEADTSARQFAECQNRCYIRAMAEENVTLAFIGMHLERLTTEVASLREDWRRSYSASTTATATC